MRYIKNIPTVRIYIVVSIYVLLVIICQNDASPLHNGCSETLFDAGMNKTETTNSNHDAKGMHLNQKIIMHVTVVMKAKHDAR